jgi:hypothetical protein
VRKYLEENVAAAEIGLSRGARYPDGSMVFIEG